MGKLWSRLFGKSSKKEQPANDLTPIEIDEERELLVFENVELGDEPFGDVIDSTHPLYDMLMSGKPSIGNRNPDGTWDVREV